MKDIKNIFTVDLEDWYMDFDIKNWENYEDRIIQSTEKILNLLEETHNYATFFVVGYIAEKHPELIEKIYNSGHEIGTHGYSHTSIHKLTPSIFKEDLKKSIDILNDITKSRIIGHRACEFSISHKTAWAIDILKDSGIKYDSSVYPVKTPLYGVPDAPLYPYQIDSNDITLDYSDNNILEIPLSIYKIPLIKYNLPIAGGFFFRLLPYHTIKQGFKKINHLGYPGMSYFHPWEIDPFQPKLGEIGWPHYYNIKNAERKLNKFLKEFKFTSVEGSEINV